MQKITIIGNLGSDAEQVPSKTPGGEPFVSFNVAVNEKRGDQETTVWYRATMGLTNVFKHLTKGKEVYVEGRPEYSVYTSKEGVPQVSVTIRVRDIQLLGN